MPDPVILSFLFNEFMVYAVFEVVAIPVEVPRNISGKIKFKTLTPQSYRDYIMFSFME